MLNINRPVFYLCTSLVINVIIKLFAETTSYPASSHASYSSQSTHTYQPPPTQSQPQQAPPQQAASYTANQSPASKYAAPSQSAFQSYPSHYAQHQKQIPEHYPAGYPVTRVAQPGNIKGYISSPHGGSSLQQQLEHANQKSGFSDDKFKMQQVKVSLNHTFYLIQPHLLVVKI